MNTKKLRKKHLSCLIFFHFLKFDELIICNYQENQFHSVYLVPFFKVGKLLDTEEYQKRVVPCVIKLFTSPDRATRVKLLQQVLIIRFTVE